MEVGLLDTALGAVEVLGQAVGLALLVALIVMDLAVLAARQQLSQLVGEEVLG